MPLLKLLIGWELLSGTVVCNHRFLSAPDTTSSPDLNLSGKTKGRNDDVGIDNHKDEDLRDHGNLHQRNWADLLPVHV